MTKGQKFKLICVGLYAGIVGICTWCVYYAAGTGPHAVAVRLIRANELIDATDLRPVDHSKIVGHYAKRQFSVGEKVEPNDVSDKPSLPSAGVLAAVVSMPAPLIGSIAIGTRLQLCLDRKAFGNAAATIASACDGKSCIVTVPLDEIPKDPAAVTRLSAVWAGDLCSR